MVRPSTPLRWRMLPQESIIECRWVNPWRTLFACFCCGLVSDYWFNCQTKYLQRPVFLFYRDIETDETQSATEINLQSARTSILLQHTSFQGWKQQYQHTASPLCHLCMKSVIVYYDSILKLIPADPSSSVKLSPSPSPSLAGELTTFSCVASNVSGPSVSRWFIGQTQLYDYTDTQGDRLSRTWHSTVQLELWKWLLFSV